MTTSLRWTSADLEVLPDDGKHYEIVDGELYVSRQPHWDHQMVSGQIFALLQSWSLETHAGRASIAPGVIFAEDDDVAPDVVWASAARLATALSTDGKLYAAPELAVEVLSPGPANERRDRDAKLKLYSRYGVAEYWIVDWRARTITVYRRAGDASDQPLQAIATLRDKDVLQSPLLPGFTAPLERVFAGMPTSDAGQA
jgi:Uma2 family endonuclease